MLEVKSVNVNEGQNNHKVMGQMTTLGHEQVLFCSDNDLGLKAIIAIHNTTLGPALGGTRIWQYASDMEALNDVLRLSRGMTFKAAISGLNLGGGKAVIIGDPRAPKSEAFMRRFGKFVNNLNGKYITAEDVGTKPKYMEYIRMETPHVTGIPVEMGGSGDPSPVTAFGTYLGMKASMKRLTGNDSLSGKKVIVQGIGNVGYTLVEYLTKENAKVFVYDIFPDKLEGVVRDFGATIIKESEVYSMPCDIYAPCALGATLNPVTIPLLNCKIVCGAANNQLLDETEDAISLQERSIIYAPDFVVNAGGLINVYTELEGYDRNRAMTKAEGIYDTTLSIFQYADSNQKTTSESAIILAQKRVNEVGKLQLYI